MMTSSGSIARFLVLGILFHLVYIGTVFDCYFTSPVVNGMRQYKLPQAQAKRLVLIVGAFVKSLPFKRALNVTPVCSGDGLRADFAFSANASRIVRGAPERVAPYLRDIVENRGAYGVSHTHVPTESRPGHVAIIGAFCRSWTKHSTYAYAFPPGGMYEDVSAVTKVCFNANTTYLCLLACCETRDGNRILCVIYFPQHANAEQWYS